MERIEDFSALPAGCAGGLLSIGKFDGVHLGHAELLKTLTSNARRLGVPSVVMTFDPPPLSFIAPQRLSPPLYTLPTKIRWIESFSPDYLLLVSADREFFAQSPEEFFHSTVLSSLRAAGLVEGANFTFGRDRAGNGRTLRALCEKHRLFLEIVPSVDCLGEPVSSSRIRRLIRDGAVDAAALLLMSPYTLEGVCVPGEHRGSCLGFPTANVAQVVTLIPGAGVYAAAARAAGGRFPAAVSIGGNPTFGVEAAKIEAHLIGYGGGDLYGEPITLELRKKLRDLVDFPSAEALIDQIRRDVARVKEIVD
ncbi:MAG: riboflavin biosynthesis protein RibF [Thermoguttaceae bacterium]|nr:riboflavin biosynthesis protein RibF [Thermoguttaceae bacterium]